VGISLLSFNLPIKLSETSKVLSFARSCPCRKPHMRISVSSCIAFVAFAALPFSSHAAEKIAISDDDGTYKTAIVSSAKECTKLCEAERDVCRGSLLLEEITIFNGKRTSKMQCRLNNGLSETSRILQNTA